MIHLPFWLSATFVGSHFNITCLKCTFDPGNLEAVLTITSHPIKKYPNERSYKAEVPITEQLPHHHKLHRHYQECYVCIPSCNTA